MVKTNEVQHSSAVEMKALETQGQFVSNVLIFLLKINAESVVRIIKKIFETEVLTKLSVGRMKEIRQIIQDTTGVILVGNGY